MQNWLNGDGTTNPGTAPPNSARSDWVNHTFTGADGRRRAGQRRRRPGELRLRARLHLLPDGASSASRINEVITQLLEQPRQLLPRGDRRLDRPVPGFLGILEHVFPSGQTGVAHGRQPDNPFPIAQVQFYAQKNTFGKDEAQDIIDHQGGPGLVGVLGRRSTV